MCGPLGFPQFFLITSTHFVAEVRNNPTHKLHNFLMWMLPKQIQFMDYDLLIFKLKCQLDQSGGQIHQKEIVNA